MSSARAAALRLLTRRDYTAAELRKRLGAREYSSDQIDEAIADLTAQGLVNDRRAAAAYVRSAARIKGRGRLRIQRELEARGLDRATVREALDELPASDEAAAIQRFLDRRRVPAQLDSANRRRVFQQLLRRGFAADLIADVLKTRGRDQG
jgi:regulatory protein